MTSPSFKSFNNYVLVASGDFSCTFLRKLSAFYPLLNKPTKHFLGIRFGRVGRVRVRVRVREPFE